MAQVEEALFFHGQPLMVDYTPTVAVKAGEVLVTGGEVHIAHLDIPANELGALASPGGNAVYKVTAAGALTVGQQVNWDNTAKKVTSGAGDAAFGVAVEAASADGDIIAVRHDPA